MDWIDTAGNELEEGQIVHRGRVVGVQLDRAQHGEPGLVGEARPVRGYAQRVMRSRELRVQLDGLARRLDAEQVILAPGEAAAEQKPPGECRMGERKARIEVDRFVQQRDAFGVLRG